MELLTFPLELNYVAGIFQCYPKYSFIYIFLNATIGKKKKNQNTHTKITKQEKPTNQPTLKCQLIQKSA